MKTFTVFINRAVEHMCLIYSKFNLLQGLLEPEDSTGSPSSLCLLK